MRCSSDGQAPRRRAAELSERGAGAPAGEGAPVVSRPAPVRLDPERIATKRAVPDSSGAAAPLTFHKTPAERARAERRLAEGP